MALKLTETVDGTLLPVRVIPRASRTQLDGEHDGAIKVRLKAPPVDGAANKALCEFLAAELGCRKRDVEVVRGEKNRQKTLLIRGLRPERIRSALV